jgi:hypothetical protein
MVKKSRGKHPPPSSSNLSEDESHIAPTDLHLQTTIQNSKHQKFRKHQVRLPFPEMMGPKCLRFAGVINGGTLPMRRKKSKADEAANRGGHESNSMDGSGSRESGGEEEGFLEATSVVDGEARLEHPGIELTVDLSTPISQIGQSGVQALLNEGSIHYVDGFIASREDPVCRVQEAEKLIEVQQALGISFDPNDQPPVDRLITMEDRDRKELANWQESNGCQ